MDIKRLILVVLGVIIAVALAWYIYQEIVKWQALREQASKTLGKAEKAMDVGSGVTGVVTKPIEGVGKMFGGGK